MCRRSGVPRLSWVKQNFLRAETLTAANAALVSAQNAIPLARSWGGGDVASADGLRFVVPVRTIHSGPNPRHFGRERGVLVQPCLRPVHRLKCDDRAGHAARQPSSARGRAGAGDRTSADRNHDRHRRIHRHDLRNLPSARLSVLTAHRRCRRSAVLAGGHKGGSRHPQRSGLEPDQPAADYRALGRPAAPRRIAQAWRRARRWANPYLADQQPPHKTCSRPAGAGPPDQDALPAALYRR